MAKKSNCIDVIAIDITRSAGGLLCRRIGRRCIVICRKGGRERVLSVEEEIET